MKGYVVTLFNIDKSVQVAQRCVNSGKQFNVDVEMVAGVWKDDAMQQMKNEKLQLSQFDQSFSDVSAVVGNFIAQYRIWKTIAESNQPGIVLEHDAVFVDNIPNLHNHDVVNLGKPSYGNFNTQSSPGVYPLFSKPGKYFPGAHGYYVTPKGAQQLITFAQTKGVAPCDIFLQSKNFNNLMEAYPWPIEAHDNFTTIQLEKGCKAKHNFDHQYQIIDG